MLFLLPQLGVPRGRPATPGAGQAGDHRLPRAVDDGGGTDAGVVPPQGDRLIPAVNARQQASEG